MSARFTESHKQATERIYNECVWPYVMRGEDFHEKVLNILAEKFPADSLKPISESGKVVIDKNWKSELQKQEEREGKSVVKAPRLRVIFAWYDIWIGVFWDRRGFLYLFPIPMLGLKIDCRKGGQVQRYMDSVRRGE